MSKKKNYLLKVKVAQSSLREKLTFHQRVEKYWNWLTSIIKKILLYLGHYLPFFFELVFHILSFLEMFCPRFCDNLYTTACRVVRRAFSFLRRQTLCLISPLLELCSWLPNAREVDKSKRCFVLFSNWCQWNSHTKFPQPTSATRAISALSATNLPLQMYLSRVLPSCNKFSGQEFSPRKRRETVELLRTGTSHGSCFH